MDPITGGIIASLVANGISSVACHVLPKSTEELRQEKAVEAMLAADPSVGQILQRAAVAVAKSAQLQDERQTTKLKLFFLSPEAEGLVRQMCGVYYSTEARTKSQTAIRDEFALSLSFYLGLDQGSVRATADLLFDALLLACERALDFALQKGILPALDAKDSIRHRILLDEVDAIRRNLEFLRGVQTINVDEILQFEVKYRAQLVERHGYVVPPNFDTARRLPIRSICVSPNLVRLPQRRGEENDPLKFETFLAGLYRAVVLGNPGGGKSTLAGRICHDLASDHLRALGGRELTAALVVLRDYGAAKKEHGYSIVQFLDAVANSHYQVSPPRGAFEYMLLNGRAMVIFDGLDELIDTHHRREISADIESFCHLYPAVPVLVTSREVGYEQAPLDETRFLAYRLAPFDSSQVRQYARMWFAADGELPPVQQGQKADSFLKESEAVSDLRANPLMLALMCNLYRGDNYIPRNRPDVYEKCATMLFDRWDKSRGILAPLAFEAHINPAMKYLAHWIYSDEKLQAGVTEQKLVAKATDYLSMRRFEDPDEAEQAARGFIEFCRGRAWVFTDTGTTKDGDRLYQFTHRTFLEYFTAAHLVRVNPTPSALISVLMPRIEAREWDVVAQLSFQLQNKQVEGAADELLRALLGRSGSVGDKTAWYLLSFAGRSLEFLVPSPKVTREIAEALLDRSFDAALRIEKPPEPGESSPPVALFCDLLMCTAENRVPVATVMDKEICERINSLDRRAALCGVDAGLNLRAGFYIGARVAEAADETFNFWSGVSNRIWDQCAAKILDLARTDAQVWIDCYLRGQETMESFFGYFGPGPLFSMRSHRMFPELFRSSLGDLLLVPLLHGVAARGAAREPILERRLAGLSAVGVALLRTSPPWFEVGHEYRRIGAHLFRENLPRQSEIPTLAGDALFGGMALLASCYGEAIDKDYLPMLERLVSRAEGPLFDSAGWVIWARWDPSAIANARAQLSNLELSDRARELMVQWMERRINFTTLAGR